MHFLICLFDTATVTFKIPSAGQDREVAGVPKSTATVKAPDERRPADYFSA